jgi:LPXTG-motif cell wall-anchored protein
VLSREGLEPGRATGRRHVGLLPIPAVLRAFLVTLAASALLAAIPVAAAAQDAGSNQYQDPLAGEPGSGSGNSNGNSSGGGNGSAPSSGTQNVPSESSGDAGAAQSREQLPATGADAWLLALAGAMLLGGGLGLRRVADRAHT